MIKTRERQSETEQPVRQTRSRQMVAPEATAAELAIQKEMLQLADELDALTGRVRPLVAQSAELPSYKECNAAWEAGDEDRNTLGFEIHGALIGIIESGRLAEMVRWLRDAARMTPSDAAAAERASRRRTAKGKRPVTRPQ